MFIENSTILSVIRNRPFQNLIGLFSFHSVICLYVCVYVCMYVEELAALSLVIETWFLYTNL